MSIFGLEPGNGLGTGELPPQPENRSAIVYQGLGQFTKDGDTQPRGTGTGMDAVALQHDQMLDGSGVDDPSKDDADTQAVSPVGIFDIGVGIQTGNILQDGYRVPGLKDKIDTWRASGRERREAKTEEKRIKRKTDALKLSSRIAVMAEIEAPVVEEVIQVLSAARRVGPLATAHILTRQMLRDLNTEVRAQVANYLASDYGMGSGDGDETPSLEQIEMAQTRAIFDAALKRAKIKSRIRTDETDDPDQHVLVFAQAIARTEKVLEEANKYAANQVYAIEPTDLRRHRQKAMDLLIESANLQEGEYDIGNPDLPMLVVRMVPSIDPETNKVIYLVDPNCDGWTKVKQKSGPLFSNDLADPTMTFNAILRKETLSGDNFSGIIGLTGMVAGIKMQNPLDPHQSESITKDDAKKWSKPVDALGAESDTKEHVTTLQELLDELLDELHDRNPQVEFIDDGDRIGNYGVMRLLIQVEPRVMKVGAFERLVLAKGAANTDSITNQVVFDNRLVGPTAAEAFAKGVNFVEDTYIRMREAESAARQTLYTGLEAMRFAELVPEIGTGTQREKGLPPARAEHAGGVGTSESPYGSDPEEEVVEVEIVE